MLAFIIPVVVPIVLCVGTAVGMFLYGMFSARSRLLGPILIFGPRESGRVALTFDDGPTAEGTGPVLDALAAARCRATFFFIGENARRCPELVQRAVAEGHLVANHSLDHSRSGIWGRTWYWQQQLTRADEAIHAAGGPAECEFFRPPMGFKSWRMAAAARHTGHRIVMWSLRGRDGVPTTAEAILGRILPRARAGDIIVLHEGAEPGKKRDPSATIAAVPGLIAGLRAKGLEPVRLDELLGETPLTTSAHGARESRSGRATKRA